MCIRVDLPDPDGPMIDTYSPGSIVNDTPRRAATAMVPVRYTLVTFSSSMTGSMSAPGSREAAATAAANAATATEAAATAAGEARHRTRKPPVRVPVPPPPKRLRLRRRWCR